jgi:glycosyltransferase involved in cell wall biosynthesis
MTRTGDPRRRSPDGAAIRIEMVLPTLTVGGQETMATRLALALQRMGHDIGVTLLEALGPLAAELRAAGCDVALVPTPGVATNLRAPALTARFRARRPHAVHAHSGVWLKAARAARAARVPSVVHTFHGLVEQEPWFAPFMRRFSARYTDAIVAVSEPLRDYLHEVAGIRRGIDVIPNGIDTAVFHPAADPAVERRALGLPEHAVVIGHVARLDSMH